MDSPGQTAVLEGPNPADPALDEQFDAAWNKLLDELEGIDLDELQTKLEETPENLDPYMVDLCENNFLEFCKYFGSLHITQEFGVFHLEIIRFLERLRPGRHALKLLPREHGKSTIINFLFVLWNVCYRKKRHIGIISTTVVQADKFLNKLKTELQNNPLIRRHFGDLVGHDAKNARETWRISYIRTRNHVVVFTAGVGGSIRGVNESLPDDLADGNFIGRDRWGRPRYRRIRSFRPDLLIFDDVIEDKHVKTMMVRDRLWEWFWDTAYNIIDSEVGNIIVVGTTVHDDDLVMRLHKDKNRTTTWSKMRRPACKGFDAQMNPIECLWPEKWAKPDINRPVDRTGRPYTEEEIDAGLDREETFYLCFLAWKRRDLGSRAFSKEFLLQPIDDSTRFFHHDWFRYWISKDVFFTPAQEAHLMASGFNYTTLPDDLFIVTSIDPAPSRGKRAEEADRDYTAIVTIGYSPSVRQYYLIDVDRFRASAKTMMHLMFKHFVAYNSQFGGKYWESGQVGQGPTVQLTSDRNWQHLGFLVETVAFQKVLADLLDELSIMLGLFAPVIEVKRGQRDKTTRALGVSALVERGQFYVPLTAHQKMAKADIIAAIDELTSFPQGAHDDCFVAETLILTKRGEVPICEVTTDDYVWTRWGWRRVLKAWMTGVKEVITKIGLTATPTHLVWTENRSWVDLADLTIDDTVLVCAQRQHEKPSSTTVRSTTGTPIRNEGNSGFTTGVIPKTKRVLKRFIGTCGKIATGVFLHVMISTIRMGTHLTMLSRISGVFLPQPIGGCTPRKLGSEDVSQTNWSTSREIAPSERRVPSPVQSAVRATGLSTQVRTPTVQNPVVMHAMSLSTVEKRSINEHERTTSSVEMRETWNLHIDEHHEFVANGVLVHNCVDGIVDDLAALQRLSLHLNRGLGAKAAMKRLLDGNPEIYAYVNEKTREGKMDDHDAMMSYRESHPERKSAVQSTPYA